MSQNVESNTSKIEIVIKALGTMVLEPQFESDPTQIGKRIFTTTIQKPIIEGEDRKKVLNKLIELVDKL